MTNPNLYFRPAQPNDAQISARLIYDAAPEYYNFVFALDKPTILDFLGKVFANGSGVFGYQRYTVATLEDQVVAIGAFYGADNRPKPDLKTLWTLIACFDPVRFFGILGRISKMSAIVTHAEPGIEYIANFAVVDSLRGQGIGKAFLQHQIQLAKGKGCKHCALNVAASNVDAQRLYEQLGFRVISEAKLTSIASQLRPPSLKQMVLSL